MKKTNKKEKAPGFPGAFRKDSLLSSLNRIAVQPQRGQTWS